MEYRNKISTKDLKVIFIVSFGNVLEYFDFFVFIYLASYIADNYFSGSSFIKIISVYATFAVSSFLRPIGGIIFGHLGDRYGRRKIFLVTISIMSVSSICMGLIPSALTVGCLAPILLIFIRMVQGLSLGAESPGSLTYIYEYMSEDYKVFGISCNLVSVFLGMSSASLIIFLISISLNPHQMTVIGWRIPFLIGGVAGIICFFARRKLVETNEFNFIKQANKIEKVPLIKLLKNYKIPLLNGLLLVISLGLILNFFNNYLPSYLVMTLKYSPNYSIEITFTLISMMTLTLIFIALYSLKNSRFNQNTLNKGFLKICVVFISVYLVGIGCVNLLIAHSSSITSYSLICIVGILLSCLEILVITKIMRFFPVQVRYSSTAFIYDIGFALSTGLVPLVFTFLIHHYQSQYVVIYGFTVGIVLSIIASLMIIISEKRIDA